MSSWYRLDIGSDPTLTATHLINAQRAFMVPFMRTPAGCGWASFWRKNETTGVSEIFFTPTSSAVALSLGAVPCDKPGIGNGHIKMLAGEGDLRDYFPGQEQQ